MTAKTHQIVSILCSQYFWWRFPGDVDTVVVKAESENAKLCAILSIQGTQVYCFCVIHFLLVIIDFLFKEAFLSSSSPWKVIEKFMREGFLKLIEYNSSCLCEVKLEFLRVLFWLFHGCNDFAIFPE